MTLIPEYPKSSGLDVFSIDWFRLMLLKTPEVEVRPVANGYDEHTNEHA